MNPFKPKTISHHDFEILSDLKWHCTKCELKSGQAKTWQIWRQRGIQLDTGEERKFYRKVFCKNCNNKTTHRKLKFLEILQETKLRSGISLKLSKKVKEIYSFEEAVLLRKMNQGELEVDHKFPQIRWSKDENINNDNMSEEMIKSKFILLTRLNNLLKSRYCEKCVANNVRGNFLGIYYWYKGSKKWEYDKNNEKGCIGCFWYDPYTWREKLNNFLKKLKK
jgi:hypothetical protein